MTALRTLLVTPGGPPNIAYGPRWWLIAACLLPDFKIVDVALKKIRVGQSDESVRTALGFYADSDIVRLEIDAAALLSLAQRCRLSVYDAAYLWLTAELKAPLATFDAKLGEAARVHLASR